MSKFMRIIAKKSQITDAADTMRVSSTKAALSLYRICAIATLYAVLVGVFGYMFMMGFYAFNTSWVAPVVLSPLDEKGLELTEKLVTTKQTMETLSLDVSKLERSLQEMRRHKAALQSLEPQVKTAIGREIKEDRADGRELSALDAQKQTDNGRTRAVLAQIAEVESETRKDLVAGLITKGDAAVQAAQLNQAKAAYTDSQISEVLLRDGVLQKNTANTQTLDMLDKRVELESQIAQLDISIAMSATQLQAEKEQIDRVNKAIGLAAQTPYFSVVSSGGNQIFAFVPYENQSNVSIGAAVYDCYLNMAGCRSVGEVAAVFTGEERAQNPIFKTDMRGFLIRLNLDNENSARSKTLFLKHKPLLF